MRGVQQKRGAQDFGAEDFRAQVVLQLGTGEVQETTGDQISIVRCVQRPSGKSFAQASPMAYPVQDAVFQREINS